MKKGIGKALEEFGKHLLNIGIVLIVFTLIQPYVSNSASIKKVVIILFIYFFVVILGLSFIWIGGNRSER
ncbi:MAG: hypothetical protein GXO21_03965 [Aquificae bacterium]|nr:hypothetical protein [Aquificota bacterium]